MIGSLRPVLHLSEPFVDISCGLADGFGEQLRSHKVGAGAGSQIAAVLYELHAPQINFTVALDCIFHRASGFGEGRRIQDDYIELLTLFLKLRKQFKYVGADKGNTVRDLVQSGILPGLTDASSEASTPNTSEAPETAALRAKEPVWVKQSSTRFPLHSF